MWGKGKCFWNEQKELLSRKIETTKENPLEIIELKNITEVKNLLNGLNIRMEMTKKSQWTWR